MGTSPAERFHSSRFTSGAHCAAVRFYPRFRGVLESVKEHLVETAKSTYALHCFDCMGKQMFGTLKNNHQII